MAIPAKVPIMSPVLYGRDTQMIATMAATIDAAIEGESLRLGISNARNVSGTAKSNDHSGGISAPKKIPQVAVIIHSDQRAAQAPKKKGSR